MCRRYSQIKFRNILFVAVTFSRFQCSASQVNLTCPDNQLIFITDAHYGQFGYTSTQDDLTCKPPNPQYDCVEGMEENAPADWLLLKTLCDERSSCSFVTPIGVMTSCGESASSDYAVVFFQCLPGWVILRANLFNTFLAFEITCSY